MPRCRDLGCGFAPPRQPARMLSLSVVVCRCWSSLAPWTAHRRPKPNGADQGLSTPSTPTRRSPRPPRRTPRRSPRRRSSSTAEPPRRTEGLRGRRSPGGLPRRRETAVAEQPTGSFGGGEHPAVRAEQRAHGPVALAPRNSLSRWASSWTGPAVGSMALSGRPIDLPISEVSRDFRDLRHFSIHQVSRVGGINIRIPLTSRNPAAAKCGVDDSGGTCRRTIRNRWSDLIALVRVGVDQLSACQSLSRQAGSRGVLRC